MRRFHYAFVVAGVTFVALLATSGVRGAPGVLIQPFEAEFGWDRASISLAVALSIVTLGAGGVMAGGLVERLGPRLVTAAGMLLVAVGLLGVLALDTLWQLFVAWGILVGTGTGVTGSVLVATVAHRWFRTHRGLVIGTLGAAATMGQLVMIPAMASVTTEVGWREAIVLLLVVVLVALVPVTLLMRDKPSDVGAQPYGEGAELSVAEQAADRRKTPLRAALRSRDFWLLAGSFFICGYTSNGLISTHLIPHAVDHGLTEVTAAGAIGIIGAMNFVGSLGSGWLTDRYDPRRLLAAYYGVRALSLAALPIIFDTRALYVFAILFGLDWSATVPPTASIVAARFGRASLGPLYGWIIFGHMIGAAVAAYAGGFFHDQLGDYHLVFISATLMGLIAVGLVSRIERGAPKGAAGELDTAYVG